MGERGGRRLNVLTWVADGGLVTASYVSEVGHCDDRMLVLEFELKRRRVQCGGC